MEICRVQFWIKVIGVQAELLQQRNRVGQGNRGELNKVGDVRAALLPEDRLVLQWGSRHVQSLWF